MSRMVRIRPEKLFLPDSYLQWVPEGHNSLHNTLEHDLLLHAVDVGVPLKCFMIRIPVSVGRSLGDPGQSKLVDPGAWNDLSAVPDALVAV